MTPAEVVAELERIYSVRADTARRIAASGRPVVGVVGADVPVELVHAAGAVGYRLHGDAERVSDDARESLGASVDPATAAILTVLLDGSMRFLTGVVVSRDSQSSLQLFYALRELRRLEPRLPIPPVVLVDVLHLPTASTAAYNRARLEQLAGQLSAWTRQPISEEGLAHSSSVVAHLRALLRAVSDLRLERSPWLTGTQALRIHGAVTTLPVEESIDLLTLVTGLQRSVPAGASESRRMFLTGSAHPTDTLYAAVEEQGDWIVVSEDHDWADGSLAISITEPGLPGLATAYRDRGPSAMSSSISQRASSTLDQATRSRADAVLAFIREHDEAPAWDVGAQRRALADVHIPLAVLERQHGPVDGSAVRHVLSDQVPGVQAGAGPVGIR